jgi:hypothetical protein
LAFAAYEVVHVLSKKRNPYRRDLLFDSDLIKDEYRSDFNKRVKQHAYFFKHADRNPEATIEFNPEINALMGRELCGASISQEESAFLWWMQIHHPKILTENGRKMISDHLDANALESIRGLSKFDFFEGFRDANYLIRKYGGPTIGRGHIRVV